MKKLLFRIAGLLMLVILCHSASATESNPEAVALLQKSESLMRSKATEVTYQVDIVRPDWKRTLEFLSHDDYENNRFRMEILSPRKTRGTVFLKVDNKLSMYLPKLRRQIAISPAMMHDAWMGSDFNNQDLLEADSLISDYTHLIARREGEGPEAIITIESFPNEDATVSWHMLVQRIRGDGMPLEIRYICKDKVPGRRLLFEAPKEMDGRVIPTRLVMEPLKKQGKKTTITVKSVKFDANFNPDLFEPMKKKKTQADTQ